MGIPVSKDALLTSLQLERAKLLSAIEKVPPDAMTCSGACDNWSVKDIMAHLADWAARCVGWYEAGLRGEIPAIPDPDFNWRQLSALNQKIYERHRHKPLDQVLEEFVMTDDRMNNLVKMVSEEDLYASDRFSWTGGKPLAVFIDANTASHYRWAAGLICKFARRMAR